MLVPVNPVCPNADPVMKRPAEERPDGVSHPRARDEASAWRRTAPEMDSVLGNGGSTSTPRAASSIRCAKAARSRALEKSPA